VLLTSVNASARVLPARPQALVQQPDVRHGHAPQPVPARHMHVRAQPGRSEYSGPAGMRLAGPASSRHHLPVPGVHGRHPRSFPVQQHLRYDVLDLDQLEPYAGNARRHDDSTLDSSISVHGQYRTLVVRVIGDPDNPDKYVILAGNGTAEALRRKGIPKARVELVVCSDTEALSINLMDNAASDKAYEIGYDEDLLAEQLRQAQEFGFLGTGWDEKSAKPYLDPAAPKPPGGGEPPSDVWAIIVEADSEDHQVELLTKFQEEGLTCRPLIS
jgi:hypothetical protein